MRLPYFLSLAISSLLGAQIPFGELAPMDREEAQRIVDKADFAFQTRTRPVQVRSATMEKIFDHPRMSMALWRYCGFVPGFFGFACPDGSWTLDDTRGLTGRLRCVLWKPGFRVYLVEGRAEAGRLKTPFAVGARMAVAYRYWDSPQGFETHLQTWTALDSAVLGIVARPFQGYIRHRQDEFIAYINGNIATFGQFAERDPGEFREPIRREGDPVAIRDFDLLFPRR
ncbi:hypothetical protein [Mesoterricola silvestris]|uniref:Uncharacterized protein n=1 Tax=Mesoterricola silvestris TaxID=2927979 RepID=A0AA48H332_9BACT|nr:hypothetical protein [Mesoterricola silvestris]BDU71028.1 hypothetical protein METEAL_02020 [Mesoterricola silvestris]